MGLLVLLMTNCADARYMINAFAWTSDSQRYYSNVPVRVSGSRRYFSSVVPGVVGIQWYIYIVPVFFQAR